MGWFLFNLVHMISSSISKLAVGITFIIFLTRCTAPSDQIQGTWIGSHVKIDQDFYMPMLMGMQIEDTLGITTTFIDWDRDSSFVWYDGDTLWVDSMAYTHPNVNITSQTWKYRPPYELTLHRPEKVKMDMNRYELRDRLSGKTWQSPWGLLQLEEGNAAKLLKPENQFSDVLCWSVRALDDYLFLVLHGNHLECDYFGYPIMQVTKTAANSIRLVYWPDDEKETFEMTERDQLLKSSPQHFQLCNSHLRLTTPGSMYSYLGTELMGGHHQIYKVLGQKFIPEADGFTGTIRVRFVVNCEGKTGRFEVRAMDENYVALKTLPQEANQLLEITKNLGPWKAGRRFDRNVDSYYFIAYKMKNGKVVDLLP